MADNNSIFDTEEYRQLKAGGFSDNDIRLHFSRKAAKASKAPPEPKSFPVYDQPMDPLAAKAARPLLEYGGMGVGGYMGGPVGAGVGYAGGRAVANAFEEMVGSRKPPPLANRLLETGIDVAEGAAAEMGGRILGGVLPGAGIPAMGAAREIAAMRPPLREGGLASKGAELFGKMVKPGLGAISRVGTANIDTAIQAGRRTTGNPLKPQSDFDRALRGDIEGDEIVTNVRNALGQLKEERAVAYRSKLEAIEKGEPKPIAADKVKALDAEIEELQKVVDQLAKAPAKPGEAPGVKELKQQIWKLEQQVKLGASEKSRYDKHVAKVKAELKAATTTEERDMLRDELLELKAANSVASREEAKAAKELEKLRTKLTTEEGKATKSSAAQQTKLTKDLEGLKERRQRIGAHPSQAGEYIEFSGMRSIDITPVQERLTKLMKQYGLKITADGGVAPIYSSSALGKQGFKDAEEIITMVKNWGKVKGERTALGLDTLKRSLDDFYSDSSSARQFVANLRQSVQEVISKEVPMYNAMTSEYRASTKLIREIEKGLGLRARGGISQASADMTLRKLMSSMRSDTSLRRELVEILGNKSEQALSEQVSGYVMRSPLPPGRYGTWAAIGAEGVLLKLVNPKLLPIIATSSPRLQAEFLRLFGRAMAESRAGVPFAARVLTHESLKVPENSVEDAEEAKK